MSQNEFNCPYGIAATCEHAQASSVAGEYQPCLHIDECASSSAKQRQKMGFRSPEAELSALEKELELLDEKLTELLQSYDAMVHSNAVLRSVIEQQAEEIHKLRAQIFNEGAARV